MQLPDSPDALGLVTTWQALAMPADGGRGLTEDAIRWRVQRGQWQRLAHGIYLERPGPVDWLTFAGAALLAHGRQAALRGPSAGYLHGVGPRPQGAVHVVVPRRVSRRMPGVQVSVDPGIPVVKRWPSRVSWEATIVDLAVGAPDVIAAAVGQGLRDRRTTRARLRDELERRSRHPARRLLTELLTEVAEGVDGPLEVRFDRDVVRRHHLPRGVAQLAASVVEGARAVGDRRRYDRGMPAQRVLVELDSALHHQGARLAADRAKSNLAARSGWLLLRYGWVEVAGHPCRTALDLGLALRDRGWRGRPKPCGPGCAVGQGGGRLGWSA